MTSGIQGVQVGGKTLFLIQGDSPQSFSWDGYGLRINVPKGTVPSTKTCEIAVTALIGGQFTFPKGSELVSVVYAVSIASEIQQPLTLEIQHCVSLKTSVQSTYMRFAKASSKQLSLPYQFHLLEGGVFSLDTRYGAISLTKFCFICVLLVYPTDWIIINSPTSSTTSESNSIEMSSSPINDQSSTELPKIDTETELESIQPAVLPNEDSSITYMDNAETDQHYFAKVFYKDQVGNNYEMELIVVKDLDFLKQCIETQQDLRQAESGQQIRFRFKKDIKSGGFIELVFKETTIKGWHILPQLLPCQILKKDVDDFGNKENIKPPSCIVLIHASENSTDLDVLYYPVQLIGIEPPNRTIFITRYAKKIEGQFARKRSSQSLEEISVPTKRQHLLSSSSEILSPISEDSQIVQFTRKHFIQSNQSLEEMHHLSPSSSGIVSSTRSMGSPGELVKKENIAIQTESPPMDNMELRMLSAQTHEIEALQKELSSCKEELLKYKTKLSHVMKPVVQLDISQYLPKLEVVLQPIQDNWEQLGVSLGIDQSVLSSIKSTTGDSTVYMRQLLEKWNMKGGQLKVLEDGLMSIGRKDLISGLHQMVEMPEVSTDITSESLPQMLEMTEVSTDVIDIEMSDDNKESDIMSMETSLAKKDVSVQFDYLIPVNDTLYGVHVAAKKLFLIQGNSPQSFNWDEYGLRINVPKGTVPSTETCEIAVTALIGGQFTFPKGSELVSVVYAVSIASEIQQPLTLEIQHCVSLKTSEQSAYMRFAKTSSKQLPLPYQFHLLEGGVFSPDTRYGTISLTKFSFICEVLVNPNICITTTTDNSNDTSSDDEAGNVSNELEPADSSVNTTSECDIVEGNGFPDKYYFAQELIKELGNSSKIELVVVKDLNALKKYVEAQHDLEAGQKIYFQFKKDSICFMELLFTAKSYGWEVWPKLSPCRIYQKVVDDFGGIENTTPPSCLIEIHPSGNSRDLTPLKYPIQLNGIEPSDMTLLITRVPKQTDYLLRKRPNQSLENIPSSKRQPLSSSHLSPVEVLRTQYGDLCDLMYVSSNRLSVASHLFSAGLITFDCYNKAVDDSPKTDMEKGISVMRAVMASITARPQLFTKLVTVLEKVEAFKSIAENIQDDLSHMQ